MAEQKKSGCRFHTDTLLLGRAHHKVLARPVARCHLVAWPPFFAPMLIIFVYVCKPEDATSTTSTWTELWVSWAQPRPATHPRDLHHPRPSHVRTLRRAGIHRPHDPVQHGHIARGWPKDSAAQMDCQCAPSNAPRKGVAWWTPTGSHMLTATPQVACGVPVDALRLHAKWHAIPTNWC